MFFMQSFSKPGSIFQMEIREIEVTDKDRYITLQRQLDEETIYMAYEKKRSR